MNASPLILLAAGGTGGHLFPAEALGVELIKRGLRVRLATDTRALRYSGLFSRETMDVVPSATVRGRTLAFNGVCGNLGVSLAYGVGMLLALTRLRPKTEIEIASGMSAANSYA